MDVKAFADELLPALARAGLFEQVSLRAEGPVADGHARVSEALFLRFYFNQVSSTLAFALIEGRQRVWGIDHDHRRGWHLHPADNPTDHIEIEPLSVSDVVARLQDVLLKRK
jgi:hypothetical protein